MASAILTINCPDQKGLVAAYASFIAKYKGNIINLDQFSDPVTTRFFMRLEWDLDEFTLERHDIEPMLEEVAEKYRVGSGWKLHFSDSRRRIAIFVSKYDHCLYDLLLRHRSGELVCDIPLIVSNHPDLDDIARVFNIPFRYIKWTSKALVEGEQLSLLEDFKIDTIVLARYMQILSDNFVKHYPNRIINVHHSFLPAFAGAKPYHQAYERGVKVIGATAHFVTSDLDEGPIIDQEVEAISHKDTIKDLQCIGRDIERKVLARALNLYLEHRLFVAGQRVIVL